MARGSYSPLRTMRLWKSIVNGHKCDHSHNVNAKGLNSCMLLSALLANSGTYCLVRLAMCTVTDWISTLFSSIEFDQVIKWTHLPALHERKLRIVNAELTS